MKKVLVDSSVWIGYFRGGQAADRISDLIDANLICLNDLILAELVPFLRNQKQGTVVDLLLNVENVPLAINWKELIGFQERNLSSGINNVGIPDLIIVQNVLQNDLQLCSFDRHFKLMRPLFEFTLF